MKNQQPKHIAQLTPTKRAIADNSIRSALLAIVVGQGKPVTIPISHLRAIEETHRLILEVDHDAGQVILRTEEFKPQILLGPAKALGKTDVGIFDESPEMKPDAFHALQYKPKQ